jgi:hypothetical protein
MRSTWRLLVIGLLLGLVGASASSHPASACSCSNSTYIDVLAAADVLVGGEATQTRTEVINDLPVIVWRFEVWEHFRGITPDVIELQADAAESSCGPAPSITIGNVALGQPMTNGRYDVTASCASKVLPTRADLYLREPPPVSGAGPPAAIVGFDADRHNLVVLDRAGNVVRFLAGDNPTYGLGLCPGGVGFIQVRQATKALSDAALRFEAVFWPFSSWMPRIVAPLELRSAMQGRALVVCHSADGESSTVEWLGFGGSTFEVDNGVVVRTNAPENLALSVPTLAGTERLTEFNNGVFVESSAKPVGRDGMTIGVARIESVMATDAGWDLTVNLTDADRDLYELWRVNRSGTSEIVTTVPRLQGLSLEVAVVLDPIVAESIDVPKTERPGPYVVNTGSRREFTELERQRLVSDWAPERLVDRGVLGSWKWRFAAIGLLAGGAAIAIRRRSADRGQALDDVMFG